MPAFPGGWNGGEVGVGSLQSPSSLSLSLQTGRPPGVPHPLRAGRPWGTAFFPERVGPPADCAFLPSVAGLSEERRELTWSVPQTFACSARSHPRLAAVFRLLAQETVPARRASSPTHRPPRSTDGCRPPEIFPNLPWATFLLPRPRPVPPELLTVRSYRPHFFSRDKEPCSGPGGPAVSSSAFPRFPRPGARSTQKGSVSLQFPPVGFGLCPVRFLLPFGLTPTHFPRSRPS